MLIVLYLLAVVVVLFVAAVVATREGDVLAPAPPDQADLDLPDGPMQPEDVAEVRFGLTLRGYRMHEVDEVLTRLARELAARDRRIGQLEQALVTAAEQEPEEGHGGWADPSGLPEGVSLTKDHAEEMPTPALPVETSAVARDEEAVHAPVVDWPEPASFDDDFPEVALPEAAAPELPEATDQDEAAGSEPPADEVPADEALAVEAPTDEAPADEAPAFEVPGDAVPADEVPSEQLGVDDTSVPPPALGPPGSGAATDAEEPTGERPPGV